MFFLSGTLEERSSRHPYGRLRSDGFGLAFHFHHCVYGFLVRVVETVIHKGIALLLRSFDHKLRSAGFSKQELVRKRDGNVTWQRKSVGNWK